MENIIYSKYYTEAENLLKKAVAQLQKSNLEEVSALSKDVPSEFIDKDKKINVVFAGQYSAGKSTILSIMTGIKLKVGQGVTTDKVNHLEWNGMYITDTPGIHTQNNIEHDEITYKEIANADLIVFVLTNEGFTNHLGKHFKKLITERGKGSEMMLVVNKMDSTAKGNCEETQKVILEKNISPVLEPEFSVEDFYISFMDAKLYLESLEETDPEEKKYLYKDSGIDSFYKNINAFIEDKKILGQSTTSLYKLEDLLCEGLTKYSCGDPCIDGCKHLLNQQRIILSEARNNIIYNAGIAIRNKTSQISKWGDSLANEITTEMDPKNFEIDLKRKYDDVNKLCEFELSKLFKDIVEKEICRIKEKVDKLMNSNYVEILRHEIDKKIKSSEFSNYNNRNSEKLGKIVDKTSKASNFLIKLATGTNGQNGWNIFSPVSTFSGSKMHDLVLNIGRFFGHKFKPWEAVKIAGEIGKVAQAVGAILSVLTIFIELRNERKQKEAEEKMRNARYMVRNSFNEAENEINMNFDELTQCWISENIDPKIKEIDSKIDEINQICEIQNKEYKNISALLDETRQLISTIHNESAK